tara:strand:- start:169 stop:462 length:294 start_codon:yes stop_codon:yes gene_type:complete
MENSDNSDGIIETMYFQYIFVFIYTYQIKVIQRYYRYYRFKKSLHQLKHKLKMNECLEDVIESGYFPPMKEYKLFEKGGFRYREGLHSFNECLQLYI